MLVPSHLLCMATKSAAMCSAVPAASLASSATSTWEAAISDHTMHVQGWACSCNVGQHLRHAGQR